MILGLSHMGLTVSNIDDSLNYYQKSLGCKVLSDAERKGEWIEKITGIPGFHTRTVYLSLSPYRHFEVFGFFHPKAIPPEKESHLRAGILYCVLHAASGHCPAVEGGPNKGPIPLGRECEDGPWGAFQTFHLRDPDGVYLRAIEGKKEEGKPVPIDLLYPVFLVENIEESLSFYRDLLGLKEDSGGTSAAAPLERDGAKGGIPIRWGLLRSHTGICLKLVSPLKSPIAPAAPWKMEQVGFTHIAFGVEKLAEYYAKLAPRVNFKSSPMAVSAGPHQGGQAVYLTSPEGITLEFIDSPLIRE